MFTVHQSSPESTLAAVGSSRQAATLQPCCLGHPAAHYSLRQPRHQQQWQQQRRRCTELRAPAASAHAAVSGGPAAQQQAEVGGQQQRQQSSVYPRSFYDTRGRLVLKNLRRGELEEWCLAAGEVARRVWQALPAYA